MLFFNIKINYLTNLILYVFIIFELIFFYSLKNNLKMYNEQLRKLYQSAKVSPQDWDVFVRPELKCSADFAVYTGKHHIQMAHVGIIIHDIF